MKHHYPFYNQYESLIVSFMDDNDPADLLVPIALSNYHDYHEYDPSNFSNTATVSFEGDPLKLNLKAVIKLDEYHRYTGLESIDLEERTYTFILKEKGNRV